MTIAELKQRLGCPFRKPTLALTVEELTTIIEFFSQYVGKQELHPWIDMHTKALDWYKQRRDSLLKESKL